MWRHGHGTRDESETEPNIRLASRDSVQSKDKHGTDDRRHKMEMRRKMIFICILLAPVVAAVLVSWRYTATLSKHRFFNIDALSAALDEEAGALRKETNVPELGPLAFKEDVTGVTLQQEPRFSPKLSLLQNTPETVGRNALERHYLSVYRSKILLQESPPQFVLFRMDTHGIGNKIRSMLGAFFLAAITDRVFLLDSDIVSSLFDPPHIGGVQLDWNLSLANGACDRNATVIVTDPARKVYEQYLVDFHRRYGNSACIIASASHGHDRQVASLNENKYKGKVMQLFGNNTSRFNWSRDILGLALQRPSEAFLQAGKSAMQQLQLDTVPPSHRIVIQLRTFYDQDKRWQNTILSSAPKIWRCVENLVKNHISDVKKRVEFPSFAVLVVSDSPVFKAEAKERLEVIDGVRVVESGLPIAHTAEKTWEDLKPFMEWFLMGESSCVIATGYSSFGLTAFFRPSQFPPTHSSAKDLFTIDQLGRYKYTNMNNQKCGKVQPTGYGDINFGIMDPPYDSEAVAAALSKYKSTEETTVAVPGTSDDKSWQQNRMEPSTAGAPAPAFALSNTNETRASMSNDGRNISVVSFSLFGNDTKYLIPCILNAQNFVPKIYPGWQMRVYHDASVPTEALDLLRCHSHVRLVNTMNKSDSLLDPAWFEWLPYVDPTVWRFLVAADPTVDAFIIRDSDSVPTVRERAAVEEWLQSGAAFHVMHDFPIHYYFGKKVVMLAGMWGGRGGRAVPNMPDLIQERYSPRRQANGENSSNFTYGGDQEFLFEVVWPLVEAAGSVRHNSFHCNDNSGIAFPTAVEDDIKGYDFVGEQVKVVQELKGRGKPEGALGKNYGMGWKLIDRNSTGSGACWVRKFFRRSKWRNMYLGCIKRRNEKGYKDGTQFLAERLPPPSCSIRNFG